MCYSHFGNGICNGAFLMNTNGHCWHLLTKNILFPTFFQSFLRGETQIPKDEAFKECIESYLHVFLKSERVSQIVGGGALSQHDCREVFR
jgi:hypothetical protein